MHQTQQVVNTVIDVVKGMGVGIFDFGKNLITGTVDLIKAVPTMVKSIPKIVETITNPKKRTEFITENAPTIIMLSKPGAIEEAVGKSIINSVSESWNKEVTNGTAYTRSRYITVGILTRGSVFVGGVGGAKAASGLGKAGTASKALKFGRIANGLDKLEDVAVYSNKVDDILRESIIIGKSNKISKGAEVIKTPFEIPAGGVAGDDLGAMLKGAGKPNSKEVFLDVASSHDSARKILIDELDLTGAFKNGSNSYQGRLKSSYGYEKQI